MGTGAHGTTLELRGGRVAGTPLRPETRESKGSRMASRLLSASLFLIAAGVLLQAVLAGLFLSGTGGASMTHVIVGAVLPYLAIVPAVSSWRRERRGIVTKGFAVAATLLLVALWVQEALGHMPFPVTTAVHVPLGVLLFSLALHLAFHARRVTSGGGPPRRPTGRTGVANAPRPGAGAGRDVRTRAAGTPRRGVDHRGA